MSTATIAGRTFRVEQEPTTGDYLLYGARGACYFLRGFTGEDTGVRAVVSFRGGQELRDRCGRRVRVVVLGGVIEEIAPLPTH